MKKLLLFTALLLTSISSFSQTIIADSTKYCYISQNGRTIRLPKNTYCVWEKSQDAGHICFGINSAAPYIFDCYINQITSPVASGTTDMLNQISAMLFSSSSGGSSSVTVTSGNINANLNTGYKHAGTLKIDTCALPSGAATSANQTTGNTSLSSIVTNTTGLATSANQTTANTSLSTIATNTGNIPAKGSATSANSSPVVIASDQAAIPTKGGNTEVTYSVASPANNAVMLASTDVSAYKTISLQITSNATSGTTVWQGCNDNTNWNNILAVDPSTNSANSALVTSSTAARGVVIPVLYRYFRIINTGTGSTTSAGTIEYLTWLSPTLANISYVIPNTPFAVTQSGTWTMQPGNTANTTPWIMQLVPGTSGGTSDYHLISAAGLNATTVKNAGGQLYGYDFYNSNAAVRYVKFYNKATTPNVGVDLPVRTVAVPPGGRASYHLGTGMLFTIGVSIGTTTGMADNDNGVVGSADLSIEIDYK